MTEFKAKMHQIRFRLGLVWGPDPAGGVYSAPSGPLAGFGGRFAAEEGLGWGRGGKRGRGGRGSGEREREGPKLPLNQGPSEPCHATDTSRRALVSLYRSCAVQ